MRLVPPRLLSMKRCRNVALPALLLVLVGCTTGDKVGVTASALHPGDEAIVLFPARGGGAELANDTRFVQCLSQKLSKSLPPQLPIYETKSFQDSLFPWFEPGHAPATTHELQILLSRPDVRARIDALHVRYLLSTAGTTEADGGFPGLLCGYNGCLGLLVGNEKSKLSIVALDMKGEEHNLKAEATGTTVVAGFIFPIPLAIAQSASDVCDDVSAQLRKFFVARTGGPHLGSTPAGRP